MSINGRSASRGRLLQSTGRGGVGNMRPPSFDRAVSGPDDYSDTRGRDPIPPGDPYVVISTGRGGWGNIRAPSRDAAHGDNASIGASPLRSDVRGRGYDRELIASIDAAHDTGLHSFGRGGAGNMALTCKTPEDIPSFRHSVLRAGYANLTAGESPRLEGAVKSHKTYPSGGSGAHARQLLYLRRRMTRLLRSVGGGSIPEEDQHGTLGGFL